jgi:hypothetical protein
MASCALRDGLALQRKQDRLRKLGSEKSNRSLNNGAVMLKFCCQQWAINVLTFHTLPTKIMIADQLLLTAKLPFVAETTIEGDFVFVRFIMHFAQLLPEDRAIVGFDRDAFLANQVVDAFAEHVVLWLEKQGKFEQDLARDGRVMLKGLGLSLI